MEQVRYRIVDDSPGVCGQILANNLPDLVQAQQLLELLKREYPELELEIQRYTQQQ